MFWDGELSPFRRKDLDEYLYLDQSAFYEQSFNHQKEAC